MLDTSYQVGYKLVNGALILDRARHTLGDLHLVALAVETAAINLPQKRLLTILRT